MAKGNAPHIPPQTDPTVGLLRNMWRSSLYSANHQKATDFLWHTQYIFNEVYGVFL